MPSSSQGDETPKKRAPRKRAPRKTVAKKTTRKRTTHKKVATPAPVTENTSATTEDRPMRKAPTPIAARKAGSKAKQKQAIVIGVIMFLGIGSSIAIGVTDEGTINVNEVIESRNERLRSGQTNASDDKQVIVPVQNTRANQLPDGGLVGFTPGTEPEPPAPVPTPATTTATSTDETATSTDAVAEEDESESQDTETSEDVETESETQSAEVVSDEPATSTE